MYKDNNGVMFSDLEFYQKSISEVNVDVKGTEEATVRLNEIELIIKEETKCRLLFQKFEEKTKYLKGQLDENSIKCILDIENCLLDILLIYKEYLYAQGYNDGKRKENKIL